MTRNLGRMRAAMATLLVASAILFGVGVLIERGAASSTAPDVEATAQPGTQSPAPHTEGPAVENGEGGEAHPAEATASPGVVAETGDNHAGNGGNESILGIDPEAPLLVIFAITVSLVAAFLVWRDQRRIVMAGTTVVALGFAGLDLLEVSHQVREGTALLVVIATAVAVGHVLAGMLGIAVLRRSSAT
jgi:hypothetical protein